MALKNINIHNVRNLQQVKLQELSRFNVFYGANGSGKTSVLEAIHLLGMARSFRGASPKTLITHNTDHCIVFGSVGSSSLKSDSGSISLGVQRSVSGEALLKVSGDRVRAVAELAHVLPVQVFNAATFDLLNGSPAIRRQYLNWGVFHVEHQFLDTWQRFQRCIKQRNKLLRRDKISEQELLVWTAKLASIGTEIDGFRKAYLEILAPVFRDLLSRLLPNLSEIELRYRQGWEKSLSFSDALSRSLMSDRDRGYTQVGPQRADINISIDKRSAADVLSRGQQKMVVCALKLAQGVLMSGAKGRPDCVYLVDDLPSELDEEHLKLVCHELVSAASQVFITCVAHEELDVAWPEGHELAMFHVEHGEISRV